MIFSAFTMRFIELIKIKKSILDEKFFRRDGDEIVVLTRKTRTKMRIRMQMIILMFVKNNDYCYIFRVALSFRS